jgi:hypothetical protein
VLAGAVIMKLVSHFRSTPSDAEQIQQMRWKSQGRFLQLLFELSFVVYRRAK